MNALSPHINIDLIESMRLVFDDVTLIDLLQEFASYLQQTRDELNEIPQECNEAVRFLAVKLRGTASEYGANRLADIARITACPANAGEIKSESTIARTGR